MSNPEMSEARTQVIAELLAQQPKIPHRTAARFLAAKYPALFKSVEIARTAMRDRTGNLGTRHRQYSKSKHEAMFRAPWSGESLPDPDIFWDTTPFEYDGSNALVMADLHIPFQVNEAIELAVKFAKKRGSKDVILLGDILDQYQESFFVRRPNVALLHKELDSGEQFFNWLRKKFPNGRIIFKKGNHEERWDNKIYGAMPEAAELLKDTPYEKMGLADLGVEVIQDRRMIYMGMLTALHGHELGTGRSNPVNSARTLQLRGKEIALVAHWHTPCNHRVRTLRRGHIGTWGLGCMCHLNPHYAPVNDWEHGFAVFERTDTDGRFILDNKTIIGGNVV